MTDNCPRCKEEILLPDDACEYCGVFFDDEIKAKFRGWNIEYESKPIGIRTIDWNFWHDEHDGTDGGDGLAGMASSKKECLEMIKEIELEHSYFQ